MNPKFVLFLILLTTLCLSFYYTDDTTESFIEGACSAENQTMLQSSMMKLLQQPIINSDNVVVDGDTIMNDVKKIVGNGKFSSCDQIKDLNTIIGKNPQSNSALPALYSYYTTKQK